MYVLGVTCVSLFKVINTVLEKTSSGGFCSNDGIVHMTLPGLPFGGVGRCWHGEVRWTTCLHFFPKYPASLPIHHGVELPCPAHTHPKGERDGIYDTYCNQPPGGALRCFSLHLSPSFFFFLLILLLPGASGWGSYHGRWGFETFSHRRACMLRGWALERLNGLRYPPYGEDKLSWLRWTTSPKSCSLM